MNSGDSGALTNLKYQSCAYAVDLKQSVDPLNWNMYIGKFENCNKCVFDEKNFWHPFDGPIVDTESELKGISRRASKCPSLQYSPNCNKSSGFCTSTFDKSNPIVLPATACPIVHNNIGKMCGPGYTLNVDPFCKNFVYPVKQ